MTSIDTDPRIWKTVLTAALIVSLVGFAVIVVGAEPATAPLTRKVQIMERILDEVMAQSSNVYVSPGGSTRGLVLEGYGVLFTVDGNLGENLAFGLPLGTDQVLLDLSIGGAAEGDGKKPQDSSFHSWAVIREKAEEKSKANLEKLKKELAEALVDYGPTLAELSDSSWVTVAVFLGSRSPFGGEGERRLVMRIAMRDLRRYSSGALSRDSAVAKVEIQEL